MVSGLKPDMESPRRLFFFMQKIQILRRIYEDQKNRDIKAE